MLEPFEEELGELLDTAHPAATLSEGWQDRARARMAAVTRRANRKERRSMRRLVYAMAFLLVIGLAVAGVFTRSRPPDAKALLISAAEAMEASQTLHIFFTGVESVEEMRPMPGEGEMWMSDRAVVFRYLGPDDELRLYAFLDADQRLWRTYDCGKQVLYQADLAPASDRLPEILAHFNRLLCSGQVTSLELTDHPDAEVSTERISRDGRAVDVVSFVYALPSPSRVVVRRVFDLDATTHRLLSARRYVWTEGTREKLLDSLREIRYDQPMPPDLATLPILSPNARIVDADVSVKETATTLSLVMTVDGKEIERCEVPKTE